ncbi:MAG: hypothetical protein Q7J27_06070 [Syntrophales bacterium]|nr:hypothetical protein [Syntrophales bacterium]
MKENGLANMFLRHFVMAIPWGLVFLVIFFIASAGIKQQVKESIDYSIKTGIHEVAKLAFDHRSVIAVKKNVKEGIEFVAKTGKKEIKNLLNDPQVKQDIKEALEYSGKHLR